jgi:hypothetical protein
LVKRAHLEEKNRYSTTVGVEAVCYHELRVSGAVRDMKTQVFWQFSRPKMPTRIPLFTEPPWALQTANGTGLKCEKPWENQGF